MHVVCVCGHACVHACITIYIHFCPKLFLLTVKTCMFCCTCSTVILPIMVCFLIFFFALSSQLSCQSGVLTSNVHEENN